MANGLKRKRMSNEPLIFGPSHERKTYYFADCHDVIHDSFTGTRAEMKRRLAIVNAAREKGKKLQGINALSSHGENLSSMLPNSSISQDNAVTKQRGRVKLARINDISPEDILQIHRLRSEQPDSDSYLNLKKSGLGPSHIAALVAVWKNSHGQFKQFGLTDNSLGPSGCESLVLAILESASGSEVESSESGSSSSSSNSGNLSDCTSNSTSVDATSSTADTSTFLTSTGTCRGRPSKDDYSTFVSNTAVPRVDALYLSRNNVGATGGAALARLLQSPCCRCVRLGLNFNDIRDEGASLLASSLSHQLATVANPLHRLMVLGLSGNNLTDRTAELFAKVLTPEMDTLPLERLFMGDNRICNRGAESLARMLRTNRRLKRLVSHKLLLCLSQSVSLHNVNLLVSF